MSSEPTTEPYVSPGTTVEIETASGQVERWTGETWNRHLDQARRAGAEVKERLVQVNSQVG